MNARETERMVAGVARWNSSKLLEAHRILFEQPPLFDLELVSACNQVCAFCPRDALRRRDAFMSEDTFAAVVDFLPPDAVVMVSGMGEATLHPRLPAWIARLSDRGISCCLVTNGTRLTPRLQDALKDAGIAQIQVSLHGIQSTAVARVVPRGARPAKVLDNLGHLVKLRRSGLRVRLNFVETADNAPERAGVASLASRHGFEFFWRRQHGRAGLVGTGQPVAGPPGCGIFAWVTFITSDGDLLPCVNDVSATSPLGTVREDTWPQVRARKRELVAEGRFFEMCSTCDDDYRWVLLSQRGLDEPDNTRKGNLRTTA